MTWNLDSERPIYAQIIERIERDIISGNFLPGSRLPSVRELAAAAAVNPNTMQKALAELERSGLVYSMRTSGRFITEDTSMIQTLKENLATSQTLDFLSSMEQLGMTGEEIIKLLQKVLAQQKEEVTV